MQLGLCCPQVETTISTSYGNDHPTQDVTATPVLPQQQLVGAGSKRGGAMSRTAYGKTWKFDASRAERDLGIKWTPGRKAIQDMAAAMLQMVRRCLC